MEWCLAGIYNVRHKTSENNGDVLGNYTGMACLWISFSLVPAILIFLFIHPPRYLYNRTFMRRWGYPFWELRR